MKRILAILLLLLLLTGCGSLSPTQHMAVTPHEEPYDASGEDDITVAEDYLGLRTAIMDMIRVGREQGRIRVITYDGNLESDMSEIVYGITRNDPLGAYAVDDMSYTCDRVVSRYEIDVRISYRRSFAHILAVKKASGTTQLRQLVENAVSACNSSLVVLINSYWEQDPEAMVAEFRAENPELVPEMPGITVTIYPETGASRILEIEFHWSDDTKVLQEQRKALSDSLDSAANYIRYRKTQKEKVQLLFLYLVGRFNYVPGETVAPLYSAVCEGVAHPWGLSTAWKLICDRAGIPCEVVEGRYQDRDHTWNYVCLDDTWYYMDLYRCITETGQFRLLTQEDLADYTWEAEEP